MWEALAGGNPDEGKKGKMFALCQIAFTFAGKFINVGAATANIRTQLPGSNGNRRSIALQESAEPSAPDWAC